MDEHDLIRTYFAPLAGEGGLKLLDDAALIEPSPSHDLVVSTDSFVEGVHFPKGQYGGNVAERLLRTNLSDLAAKGARPIGYTLNLAWPKGIDIKWLKGFAAGLKDVQDQFSFHLLGGDTVILDGPLVSSVTIFGQVPKGTMVQRAGALAGDDIWITGNLGQAKLGCDLALGKTIHPKPAGDDLWHFEEAYWRPEIHLSLRHVLREKASSALDISDGIIRDAGHICRASQIGMTLNFDALPLTNGTENWVEQQADPSLARQALFGFGDDYQILFTSDPGHRQSWFDLSRDRRIKLSLIGDVVKGDSVKCLDINGVPMAWDVSGYSHF